MSLARPFTIVGSATLVSRVTGFLRDILIAALLGTSAIADVYVVAYLIPNLVRRMVSEGALNAAIVPRIARLESEGGFPAARDLASEVLALLSVVAIVLVMVAEFLMPQIMAFLAQGFRADPEKFAEAVYFARVAFPFVGFVLVAALMSAVLNAGERYAIAALVPVILNILLILVLVTMLVAVPLSQREAGLVLIVTVLVAGFLQMVLLMLAAHRVGFSVRPRILDALRGRLDPQARSLLLLSIPGMLVAGSGHVHMIVASQFASFEPRGVSWLYFADRLFQLPLGFVASAVGIVLLPRMARAITQDDAKAAAQAESESLVFAALLILPAALGLYLLAGPIVSVLFQRAAFTAGDATATSQNLRILAMALPAFVAIKVVLPSFLAREAMRVPLGAVVIAILANAGMAWFAISGGLSGGPALGVAAGAWVNAVILGFAARRTFSLTPGTPARLLGILAATGVMGWLVSLMLPHALPYLDPGQSLAIKGPVLLGLCLVGLLAYLGLARIFGALGPSLALLRSRVE